MAGFKVVGIASYPKLNTPGKSYGGDKDEYSVRLYITADSAKKLAVRINNELTRLQTAKIEQYVAGKKTGKLVDSDLKGVKFNELDRPLQKNDGADEAFPASEYPAFVTFKKNAAYGPLQIVNQIDEENSDNTTVNGGDKISCHFTWKNGYKMATTDESGNPILLKGLSTWFNGVTIIERSVVTGLSASADLGSDEE